MNRFSKMAAVLAAVPVLAVAGSAIADSPGQLTGGSNVLVVKNLTKNGSYASSASAACSEEVQYSVRLHNAANGGLTNVLVKASLPNSVTAVPAEGASQGTTGSVSITVASGGSMVYENGTTNLYDANGNVVKTLPDTITTNGVNVGTIQGSTTEFVNFKAKVNCPTPTPTPTPAPTPTPTPAPQAPTSLPNTGAGDVLGVFTGASAAGAAAHASIRRFRRK